ncbi:hypothetical protein ACIQLJ_09255 [Microbacterium sp. NPDC091313]
MQLRSTSTHRTYRYLRLSLLVIVVLLALAVGVQLLGGSALPSISASYYTPARNAFVGGLCAVALALLTLSGRSIEQALLDLAAVLAPVIAFVPVPLRVGDVPGAGGCDQACLPAAALADLDAGMTTLALLAPVVLVLAIVLAVLQRTLSRGLVGTFVLAAALAGAIVGWWRVSPDTFARSGHYVATVAFFLLIAAVAVLAAVRPAAASRRRRRGLRAVYAAVAVGLAASLVFLLVAVASGRTSGTPLVLIGESAALGLFAVFWLAQSVEFWDDVDPSLRGDRRE